MPRDSILTSSTVVGFLEWDARRAKSQFHLAPLAILSLRVCKARWQLVKVNKQIKNKRIKNLIFTRVDMSGSTQFEVSGIALFLCFNFSLCYQKKNITRLRGNNNCAFYGGFNCICGHSVIRIHLTNQNNVSNSSSWIWIKWHCGLILRKNGSTRSFAQTSFFILNWVFWNR